MPVQKVNIETFLELATKHPVIDVRSPAEFAQAHIQDAYSLPLFTDEERKVVGTAYKQQSKQEAIKIGLRFLEKKMVRLIEEVEALTGLSKSVETANALADSIFDISSLSDKANVGANDTTDPGTKTVLVHCWRGGMRSGGVAWLLNLYGFKVYTLEGGYKNFRNWVLKVLHDNYNFKVLSGYTGSGKTEILQALKAKGEKVIDLEQLANHKGSAFGNIGLPQQPSQEMFENKLALQLWEINRCAEANEQTELNSSVSKREQSIPFNNGLPTIWIEDESQRIGSVNVPISLWQQIRTKPLYFINVPFEERLNHILTWYGKGDKDQLVSAILRIKKRLGGLETKTAVNFLLEDDLAGSARVLLHYYDKLYLKGLQNRDNWQKLVTNIDCNKVDAEENASRLLETIDAVK